MKFATKLAIALWIGITIIYGANGLDRIRREAALFEADMDRDHTVMGRGLGAAIAEVWESEGQEAALDLVERANQRESDIFIRWVGLEGPVADARSPEAPSGVLDPVRTGQPVTWQDAEGGRQYSYVPLSVDGRWTGAIELSESLARQQAYLRASIMRVGVMTLALILMSGVVVMALGARFVGRPIRLLADKARRVGEGDFSGELDLRQDDELGDLAREMNAMSVRLAAARERLDAETAARISALEQLRHGERVMTVGKLASGVAHELGTPLNVIAHRTRLVASGRAEGESARENARIASEQCDRITRIVRQLLDYARRGTPDMRAQAVAPIVNRALDLLEPLARKHGVEIVVEPGSEAYTAAVDAPQIQQVVTNLAMNAVQAMPEGGRVTVRVEESRAAAPADLNAGNPHWVRVVVADTGQGIPEEHLGLIFDPFFTTKDVGEGTGLGLSVAWGIAREHGGFIDVASRPGQGSVFGLYLPAGAA